MLVAAAAADARRWIHFRSSHPLRKETRKKGTAKGDQMRGGVVCQEIRLRSQREMKQMIAREQEEEKEREERKPRVYLFP